LSVGTRQTKRKISAELRVAIRARDQPKARHEVYTPNCPVRFVHRDGRIAIRQRNTIKNEAAGFPLPRYCMEPLIRKIREYVSAVQNFFALLSLLLAVPGTGCGCKSEPNAK
jgi:hypothetical protein